VKLKDSIVSALSFYKAREAEISWVDAMLDMTRPKTDTSIKHDDDDGQICYQSIIRFIIIISLLLDTSVYY